MVPPTPEPGAPSAVVGTPGDAQVSVEWMADNGISEGFDDGTCRPTVAVSRQAMSAFLYRFDTEL
ncbi:MAG: hypothetical protein JJU45_03485 [Acidimicrobiia bacterium]|nr:hypothetical protein [Acidimicrobiia bacterium]